MDAKESAYRSGYKTGYDDGFRAALNAAKLATNSIRSYDFHRDAAADKAWLVSGEHLKECQVPSIAQTT